jgi:hypothetical protein
MAQKPEARKFAVTASNGGDIELIAPAVYAGTIEQARYITMADSTERLWVGVRLENNRYVTTLCPVDDAAKAAYKTKGLITATAKHLGGLFLPVDAELFVGASLEVDVVKWTPSNSGVAVNDIRGFAKSSKKAEVDELIAGLAADLSAGNITQAVSKGKQIAGL